MWLLLDLIALFVLFALGIFAFSRFNVRIYLSSFKCKSVWGFQTMRTYYLRKRIHEFCTRSMQLHSIRLLSSFIFVIILYKRKFCVLHSKINAIISYICKIFKLNIYNWHKKSYSSFLLLSGKIFEYLNWHCKLRILKLYSSKYYFEIPHSFCVLVRMT